MPQTSKFHNLKNLCKMELLIICGVILFVSSFTLDEVKKVIDNIKE